METAAGPPPPPPPPPFQAMVEATKSAPIAPPVEAAPVPIRAMHSSVPAALAGAMMKDKKPFTYTPGGLDLSEIKSSRMQRRLQKNAACEGVRPSQQPPSPTTSGATPPLTPQGMVQVLPMPGMSMGPTKKSQPKEAPKPKRSVCGPPPPPPPFSINSSSSADPSPSPTPYDSPSSTPAMNSTTSPSTPGGAQSINPLATPSAFSAPSIPATPIENGVPSVQPIMAVEPGPSVPQPPPLPSPPRKQKPRKDISPPATEMKERTNRVNETSIELESNRPSHIPNEGPNGHESRSQLNSNPISISPIEVDTVDNEAEETAKPTASKLPHQSRWGLTNTETAGSSEKIEPTQSDGESQSIGKRDSNQMEDSIINDSMTLESLETSLEEDRNTPERNLQGPTPITTVTSKNQQENDEQKSLQQQQQQQQQQQEEQQQQSQQHEQERREQERREQERREQERREQERQEQQEQQQKEEQEQHHQMQLKQKQLMLQEQQQRIQQEQLMQQQLLQEQKEKEQQQKMLQLQEDRLMQQQQMRKQMQQDKLFQQQQQLQQQQQQQREQEEQQQIQQKQQREHEEQLQLQKQLRDQEIRQQQLQHKQQMEYQMQREQQKPIQSSRILNAEEESEELQNARPWMRMASPPVSSQQHIRQPKDSRLVRQASLPAQSMCPTTLHPTANEGSLYIPPVYSDKSSLGSSGTNTSSPGLRNDTGSPLDKGPLPWMRAHKKESSPPPEFLIEAQKTQKRIQRQRSLPDQAKQQQRMGQFSPRSHQPIQNMQSYPEMTYQQTQAAPLIPPPDLFKNQAPASHSWTGPALRNSSKPEDYQGSPQYQTYHQGDLKTCDMFSQDRSHLDDGRHPRERIIPIMLEQTPPSTPVCNPTSMPYSNTPQYYPQPHSQPSWPSLNPSYPSGSYQEPYHNPSGYNSSNNALEALQQMQENLSQLNTGLQTTQTPPKQNGCPPNTPGQGPQIVYVTTDNPMQSKSFKLLQNVLSSDPNTKSSEMEEEPRKYTGSNIPSRSFKMLQAMTDNENYQHAGQSNL